MIESTKRRDAQLFQSLKSAIERAKGLRDDEILTRTTFSPQTRLRP